MTISSEDIRHIANLARLQVGAEEADSLGKDMNAILVHFERLKNLDLSGIDPFAREDLEATPWREDVVKAWKGRGSPFPGTQQGWGFFPRPENFGGRR